MKVSDQQWFRIDCAFWAAVVAEFPEVKTGDLDPRDLHDWEQAARRAINAWLLLNHPRGFE